MSRIDIINSIQGKLHEMTDEQFAALGHIADRYTHLAPAEDA